MLPLFSYTFLYNLLYYPAGVVPITRVLPNEEKYEDRQFKNDRLAKFAQKAITGCTGMPVGVQVVALPFRDEVALRVMKDLEGKVKPDFDKNCPAL